MEYYHTSKIIKTGTSLCIVIPKKYLRALKWERGDQIVFVATVNNSLVVRKISVKELMSVEPDIAL